MKKLLAVTVVLALLVSCGGGGGGGGGPTGLQTKTFWAQRITDEKFYRLEAELLVQNTRCEIWAEKGSGVTAAQAQSVASAYSSSIYPKMISAFSDSNFSFLGYRFSNIMEFADALTDGNGKLTILLLNIRDGYVQGSNDAFVAGYFSPFDFFPDDDPDYPSNERDMLYIDVNPLPVGSELFYSTIAHEMQHLMNFATSVYARSELNSDGQIVALNIMDTWIDEGLSSAAEWIYLEKPLEGRLMDFNASKLIAKGNNFFVWGNRRDEDTNAILDDYATVYLFFQWLRLQTSGNNTIYKNIIASEKHDYQAITTNTAAITSNWSTLLGTWLRANYNRSPSGLYGYSTDTVLNSIKRHYAPGGAGSTIGLYPGEGVYSNVTSSFPIPPSSSNNIRYIDASTGQTSGSISSGALITYNVNTVTNVYNNNGGLVSGPVSESGTITGVAPPNANITTGRSVLSGVRSGPFPISAGDMLRRGGRDYGYERNFTGVNNPRFLNQRFLTEAVIE